MTAIYVLLGVTGTLGNTMVCAVIFRNISMRTSTNLFLFTLAVADIVILLMGEFLGLFTYSFLVAQQLNMSSCFFFLFVCFFVYMSHPNYECG